MKLIIAGVAGFVIAAGAGTMVSAKRHAADASARMAAHADSLAVHDSTAAHDARATHDSTSAHDSTGSVEHVGDSSAHTPMATDSATGVPPSVGAHDAAPTAEPGPVHVSVTPDSTSSEGAERMARIFGAMKPEEAARLLEPMDDEHIRVVLLALSDRKAAAIMAQFKGDRAARLTRAMITNGGGR
jgi:Flp pilus assembly protein TadG